MIVYLSIAYRLVPDFVLKSVIVSIETSLNIGTQSEYMDTVM